MNSVAPLAAYGFATVAASWIVTHLIHSLICIIAALIVAMFVRAPELRVILWRAALVFPLLTATIATFLAATVKDRPQTSLLSLAPALFSDTQYGVDVDAQLRKFTDGTQQATIRVHDAFSARYALPLVSVALVGALLFSGSAYLRRRRALTALEGRLPYTDSELLNDAPRLLNGRAIRLSISPTLASPIALPNDEICLSANIHSMTDTERRAILMHELAHIELGDPRWAVAGHWLAAAIWWQPLNRLVLRRMHRDAEFAADAGALQQGASAKALVQSLMTLVEFADTSDLQTAGAPLVRGASPVVLRASRILSRGQQIPLQSAGRRRAIAVALVVLALAGAAAPAPVVAVNAGTPREAATMPEARTTETVYRKLSGR